MVTHPLLNTILLKNTPSDIKATVLSGFGQLDAIGQLLSGVIMVRASVAFGIKGMYGIAAALLLIPIIFLTQLFSRGLKKTSLNSQASNIYCYICDI